MRTIFLLRAFGDFLIAIYSFRNAKNKASVRFVASKHHEALFKALPKILIPQDIKIEFVDFGIDKTLLRFFTNKFFFSSKTVQEINKVKKKVKELQFENLFVEQKMRLNIFKLVTGFPFKSIVDKQNVYKAYSNYFGNEDVQNSKLDFTVTEESRILILPSTRQLRKDFPAKVLQKISDQSKARTENVTIGFYKFSKRNDKNCFIYNDFSELISYVENSDFIICADSLQAHLAQFLEKPHFILYNNHQTHKQFLTPFAEQNNSYANFNNLEKLHYVFNASL
ncbi:MAG: hypothetical protein EPO57_02455 [Chitinophagaceae bacterium]|nr:MAG: hypothetical protein EPO57_02455 [Chitinophagaceae bacterium]